MHTSSWQKKLIGGLSQIEQQLTSIRSTVKKRKYISTPISFILFLVIAGTGFAVQSTFLRLVLIAVALVPGFNVAALAIANLKDQQKINNFEAHILICKTILEPKRNPFFLFLRSFQDANKYVQKSFTSDPAGNVIEGQISLEDLLNVALKKVAPIVRIGSPGPLIGAGAVEFTDDEWWGAFQHCTHLAKAIFVIPSNSAGCIKEIRYLKQEHKLTHCIFFNPPASESELQISEHWKSTLETWKSNDIMVLPEWSSTGMFIVNELAVPTLRFDLNFKDVEDCRTKVELLCSAINKTKTVSL